MRAHLTVGRLVTSILAEDLGAGMVEFAVAATVFTFILLGILEFGFAAWAKNSVTADAREGARYAMVHGSSSGRVADSAMVANFVKSKTALGSSIVVITTWPEAGSKAPGKKVVVKVKKSQARRGPFLPARVDSSSSTMVVIF